MAKRTYRSIDVKAVDVKLLLTQVGTRALSVGVDVAKEKFYAAFMLPDGVVALTVKWRHPAETPDFVALMRAFSTGGARVALESTSRYGDILVDRLRQAGILVHGASTKRVHDAAEEYDGVPSKHDAKDAAVIADLLRRNRTHVLREVTESERRIGALTHLFLVFRDRYGSCTNRLEGELARFWPELSEHLSLQSVSLLTLLEEFGGPAAVAAAPHQVKQLLHKAGRSMVSPDVIDAIVTSAGQTAGTTALPEEQRLVKMLAQDALRALRDMQDAEKNLHAVAAENPSVIRQAEVIGLTTAAVLVAKSGDVEKFGSPAAYLKNLGLNLKENSSGKGGQRGVSVTKRGNGRTRQYLFLASLRLLQTDPIVKAWYMYQTQRPGSVKMKIVVALMRKVVKALWYVARGATFDARKLFDTRLFIPKEATDAAA